jgi:hypothetical protein
MADKTLTISETDLLIIEQLAEHKLTNRLRAFLLNEFGKDGCREQIHACQTTTYARCECQTYEYYECCGNCIPYRDEPLLYQIAEIVALDEVGLFDFDAGKKVECTDMEDNCF